MSLIDLAPLKQGLQDNVKLMSGAYTALTGQATPSILNVVPAVGQLQKLLPSSISNLLGSANKIGSAISSISNLGNNPIAGIKSLVNGLKPDLSALKTTATAAAAGIQNAAVPTAVKEGITESCKRTVEAATAVETKADEVLAQIVTLTIKTPSDSSQIVSEITTTHNAIGDYFSNLSAFMFDPGSNQLPKVQDMLDAIVSDQTKAKVYSESDASVDLSHGQMSKIVYNVAAITREVNMRNATKASLYTTAISDTGFVSVEIKYDGSKAAGEYKVMSPVQTEGI